MDWSQIVEHHGPMVWRIARRLLNHESDAADCFQKTFVSAWELSQQEPIGNWGPLLNRLAHARALDGLRQRKRQARERIAIPDEGPSDSRTPSPIAAAGVSELAEHLREALAELDPRQAQVFCLAALEGLSYDEIAGQLRITVNHVGVLLNRARAFLRSRLAAHRPPAMVERRKE
jgi:RNA polymerase sigma-70 factor (ECF subfamily)